MPKVLKIRRPHGRDIVNLDEALKDAIQTELLEAIRRKVASWNVSQTEASRRVGICRASLSLILSGKRVPSIDSLVRLSALVGLSVTISVTDH
jgi:predicted XRE-type DNA-binding protein